MPDAASSGAFLKGEGIPVELGQVDAELARLWGPAAEREGGPDLDNPTVTRLVLANLVLADLESDGVRTHELLEGVARRYPSRMIALRRSGQIGRELAAEVSAVCHLPAPGLPQVCAERIVLWAGAEALDMIPGAVRPLLETDLPLVLWWVGDPRPAEALFQDLADESARVILDLPDPEIEPEALRIALADASNRYGRDIAWFGVTIWRELVAHFFDAPGSVDELRDMRTVRITATAPEGSTRTPRVAVWLASWLAGQLGWKQKPRSHDGGTLSAAEFEGPAGPIRVEFITTRRAQAAPLAHIAEVVLEFGTAGRLSAERPEGKNEVRIEASMSGHCQLPRLVRVPEWDAARRLAAALESARDDPPYRQALPHLRRLLDLDRG